VYGASRVNRSEYVSETGLVRNELFIYVYDGPPGLDDVRVEEHRYVLWTAI
jgi:hypothetical protein